MSIWILSDVIPKYLGILSYQQLDVSVSEKMSSDQRKQNIKSLLNRGDLKLIARKLEMSYSYLSQAFSPTSSFNFTSELARKVENAMGWQENCLDSKNISAEQGSTIGLHMLVLMGRATKLASCFPEKRLLLHQKIEIANLQKHLDILIFNTDGSVFMVAEQSLDYKNPYDIEQLIVSMAISGAQYGVIFNLNSGVGKEGETSFTYKNCQSRWFEYKDGKVIEANSGPAGVFEEVGI